MMHHIDLCSGIGGFERELLRSFSWWLKRVTDIG